MNLLDFEETDLEKTIDVIGKRKDKVKARWNCAIVKTSIFFSTERQPLCEFLRFYVASPDEQIQPYFDSPRMDLTLFGLSPNKSKTIW
jgi:hypothetical protein